ncbi:MAG: NAD(P)H-hydrate epimerase, partial [Firmicutes bacterium]|nr:NAD(P)H-hydrate epimerase [Bacillota bacterium]
MRIVTAAEMGAIDRLASNEFGIPGVVLMENAGLQVVKTVETVLGNPADKHVVIFAGKGNNGGDGFVAARHLLNKGAQVQVFLAAEQDHIKGDARINLDIWTKAGQKVLPLTKASDLNLVRLALMHADLVVDALYGTGFKGAIKQPMLSFMEAVNECGKPVVAVDIPSGLEADTGRSAEGCIRASHTVTFALPKIGLLLPESKPYVGKLQVADISIPAALLADNQAKRYLITKQLVSAH